jgi:hypothetical protein
MNHRGVRRSSSAIFPCSRIAAVAVAVVLVTAACSTSDEADPVDGPPPPADCTGTGKACTSGSKCRSDDDCEGTCVAGACAVPSDTDGKKDNGETDTDCGGPSAKKCGIGKVCTADPDCGLAFCASGTCAAPSATDKVQNGTETDVDCGGSALTYDGVSVPAAPACAAAKKCLADGDCESSVCADNKLCVEAPSCRPLHGGYTCGTGEVGPDAKHESCCRSLPVPGLTMMQGAVSKQVYLDKYEITAGRIRAWVTAIKAQYGGVPNIQAWVKTRMGTDPILAAMFPGNKADYLPAQSTGQLKAFPTASGGTEDLDIGLQDQLGPSSFYRGVLGNGGTSGCGLYEGSYGHRTYWFDEAESKYFDEVIRPASAKDVLDEKSMNCITPLMFTAFCAWDGGYLQSVAAISKAYGPSEWPWGSTPTPKDNVAKMANYNEGTGSFSPSNLPRYLFPIVNFGTFANDFTPIIAAPGRFPKDASQVRPAADTWMDLGGNMLEWSQNGGGWFGWTGSSFEGHFYGRTWDSAVYYVDKYGKGGARCMRLK